LINDLEFTLIFGVDCTQRIQKSNSYYYANCGFLLLISLMGNICEVQA